MVAINIGPKLVDAIIATAKQGFNARIQASVAKCEWPKGWGEKVLNLWLDAEPGRRDLYNQAVAMRYLPLDRGVTSMNIVTPEGEVSPCPPYSFYRFGLDPTTHNDKHLRVPACIAPGTADSITLVTDDADIRRVRDEVLAGVEERKAAIGDQQTFVAGVRALLAKHTKLNDACKEWPRLRDLVPRDVLGRMDYVPPPKPKIVKQKKSDPALDSILEGNDIDTEKLDTLVVANTIISSTLGGNSE